MRGNSCLYNLLIHSSYTRLLYTRWYKLLTHSFVQNVNTFFDTIFYTLWLHIMFIHYFCNTLFIYVFCLYTLFIQYVYKQLLNILVFTILNICYTRRFIHSLIHSCFIIFLKQSLCTIFDTLLLNNLVYTICLYTHICVFQTLC